MRTPREFLITAGRLGLGVASVGVGILRSRESVAAGAPRTVHLEAREVKWGLVPGKTIKAMAYNGQVPGPTIRAREGKRLRIALHVQSGWMKSWKRARHGTRERTYSCPDRPLRYPVASRRPR